MGKEGPPGAHGSPGPPGSDGLRGSSGPIGPRGFQVRSAEMYLHFRDIEQTVLFNMQI